MPGKGHLDAERCTGEHSSVPTFSIYYPPPPPPPPAPSFPSVVLGVMPVQGRVHTQLRDAYRLVN